MRKTGFSAYPIWNITPMADSAEATVALYYSAQAAEQQGTLGGDTPAGRVEFTARYSTVEAAEANYKWPDKILVWQGKDADLTNIGAMKIGTRDKELNEEPLYRRERIPVMEIPTDEPLTWNEAVLPAFVENNYPIDGPLPARTQRTEEVQKNKTALEFMLAAVGLLKKKRPEDPSAPPLRILICQDASEVHSSARSIVKALNKKGFHVELTSVDNQAKLVSHLAKLKSDGKPGPDAVFMDVGGVGTQAALKVIKWFDDNHPESPLPALNFLSLSTSMAISEAARLARTDERVRPSFVDPAELTWLVNYLDGRWSRGETPESSTFREVLNARGGTKLPLTHKAPPYHADELKKLQGITNDGVLEAWMNGKLGAGEAIERMRGYAEGVAKALQEGLYGQQGQTTAGVTADASFYASAGFPMRGRAVFSLQEVERAYNEDGRKPVLFMQSYDPEVVPVLADGKLGGLVVTSPYMASHLKLLCETHMVSGLFGMIPPGKSLRSEFNEEARPDLPPYFADNQATLAGKAVGRGQEVLVGVGGNGVALTPPPADPSAVPAAALSPASVDHNEKLRADLRNLRQIERCFSSWFRSQGLPMHGVKANVDSGDERILDSVKGVGVVRTEQMVATNARRVGHLKRFLLQGDHESQMELKDNMTYAFGEVLQPLRRGKPVKIRLYDFVHSEILNPQEQKQFVARYGKLDIHGGEALATWPDLYRNQAEAIFYSLKYMNNVDTPLEIMMPAVRTEEDAIKIKELVDKAAREMDVDPSRYRFGVMIETLESCKNIAAIAKHCDFISFGTNDLTSEYFNMSRADLKAHAGYARKHGFDPFKKLAPEVFEIMQDVVRDGREARPGLKIDVCGAQAADPDTAVKLFNAGIDNVSVAPTLANLYALPAVMNYKLYDEAKPKGPSVGLQQAEPVRLPGGAVAGAQYLNQGLPQP